jgi:putative ABC transport system substrate-binding protein
MKRRDVLVGLLLAAVAALSPAEAQELAKTPLVGVLFGGGPEAWPPLEGLRQGLHELGYVQGKDYRLEYRWAKGQADRLAAMAAELVALPVDVIVTFGTPATLAAQRATAAIPIVMSGVGDPIGIGAVSGLSRPGGNTTGLSSMVAEMEAKRLEMLSELLPHLRRVGVMMNPANASVVIGLDHVRHAGAALHVELTVVEIRDESGFEGALSEMLRARPEAVLVMADGFLESHETRIVEFLAQHRLPAIYSKRQYVEYGGLLSYAPNYHELFRRAAIYVDKILKGAKPGDLPIEQPTNFETLINLKTAQALGLTIPPALLARADEVIE